MPQERPHGFLYYMKSVAFYILNIVHDVKLPMNQRLVGWYTDMLHR